MNESKKRLSKIRIGDHIRELPKSNLPASAAVENGGYPFICSSEDIQRTDTFLENEPAVLMGTGGVATVHLGMPPFAYSTDTWGIRSATDNLDTEYLYRILSLLVEKIDYAGFEGSGLRHLRKSFVRNLQILVPENGVSRRITYILRTIDRAIERTEALIDKYKQIKAGLMHDLFTRGIGPDGQLRPLREQAPELYQETPIGWIPKEWEVFRLGEIGEFTNGLNKPKEAFGVGTKFINISDVYRDYLRTEFFGRVQTTESETSSYSAREGDIFIDRSSVKLEGVGYPTVFEGCDEPVVFSGFIIRYRLNKKDSVIPRFLCIQMRLPAFRSKVFQVATKSANVNINQASLSKLYVAIPSFEEQVEIVRQERIIDRKTQAEMSILEKLQAEKSALMVDLLTGIVAVESEAGTAHV